MIKLFNTLTRKKENFRPLKGKSVRMYSCGPTVYDTAHLGNFRSFLFADFLRRTLSFDGYKVKQVMNITDVGHLVSDADTGADKIEQAAAKRGESAWDIARRFTKLFEDDRTRLNILPPAVEPKATEHIQEQIDLIKRLEKKGFTYRTGDGVYFDTSKFPAYGRLSRQKVADKKSGARVALGEKRQASDFALWRFSKDEKRQMEWPSPWGVGFPGWHIECSAMSVKYLGQPFDIHTGGVDHLAVHHEDEIAQSEAAFGKPLAAFWMHGEFLVLPKSGGGQTKIAKSLGNSVTVEDLQNMGIDPLAYRYLCLTVHYRTPLTFSIESVRAAEQALRRLREFASGAVARRGLPTLEKQFVAAINDDLNFPKGLGIIWKAVGDTNNAPQVRASLLKFDTVLGLRLTQPQPKLVIPEKIKQLAKKREAARRNKKWDEADSLRKEIENEGYSIDDTSKGTKISPF